MKPRTEPQRAPNYNSRSMQFRLLLLVGSLMLVLLAMDKARQPESWAWMGFDKKHFEPAESAQGENSAAQPEVSERLVDLFSPAPNASTLFDAMANQTRTAPSDSQDSSDSTTDSTDSSGDSDSSMSSNDSIDDVALRGTLERFLELTFVSLENPQRETLTQSLFALLSHRELSATDQTARAALSVRLRQIAAGVDERLREEARQAVIDKLPPAEIAPDPSTAITTPWDSLLDDVVGRFSLLAEAIEQGAFPDRATVGDLANMQQLGEAWDRVLLSKVQDLSVGHHHDEQHAWFRLLEQLDRWERSGEPPQPVPVTAYELDRQPVRYRGKWVRITGEVRRIVREPVPADRAAVAPPWTLWLRPSSGPETLICIAVRRLPTGFPQPDKDQNSRDIKEPVVIDGAFFKRMGYVSGMGTLIAPQLVANDLSWKKLEPTVQRSQTPGIGTLLALAVGCIAVAVLVARAAFRATATGRSNRRVALDEASEQQGVQKLTEIADQLPASAPVIGPPQESSPPPPSNQLLLFVGLSLGGLLAVASGSAESLVAQESTPLPPWLSAESARQVEPPADSPTLGWSEEFPHSELDRLGDSEPLQSGETIALQLLSRLEGVGPITQRQHAPTLDAQRRSSWLLNPANHRLELAEVSGQLESLEILELDELTADRFDREVVYRVVIRDQDSDQRDDQTAELNDSAETASTSVDPRTVAWLSQVPPSWEERVPVGDLVRVFGSLLHLERVETESGTPVPLIISSHVEWYPRATPAALREAWYPFQIDAHVWELAQLNEGAELRGSDGPGLYRLLAATRSSSTSAAFPAARPFELFAVLDQPAAHQAEVLELNATIKRITEIGTGNDIYALDAGIERYYQIDLLVALDGKQVRLSGAVEDAVVTNRYPLTVCMSELPEGFAPSPDLDLPVNLTALFYRNWRYRSEYLRRIGPDLKQVAPLMIGIELQLPESTAIGRNMLTQVAIGVFVIAMAGTMIGFLWLKWSDQKYAERLGTKRRAGQPDQIDFKG